MFLNKKNAFLRIAGFTCLSVVVFCSWISILPDRQSLNTSQETNSQKIYTPKNCTNALLESAQKLVFFVGEARTGSTVLGSLLDAHPHVIVSSEYNMLAKMTLTVTKLELFRTLFQLSYAQTISGSRAPVEERGVYNQNVPGLWQGRIVDHLEVIGDKKAALTLNQAMSNEELFYQKVDYLRNDMKLNLKILEIVRNPFDIIANQYLRSRGQYKTRNQTDLPKEEKDELLESKADGVFNRLAAAQKIKSNVGADHFHLVYNEDLVLYPKATLQEICDFLEIQCTDQFFEKCGSIIYESPHLIRALVNWPQNIKDSITRRLKQDPVLERYSFED